MEENKDNSVESGKEDGQEKVTPMYITLKFRTKAQKPIR